MARCARLERRYANLGLGTARDFLQRQFEVVAQVRTAIDAAATTAASTRLAAENLAEDVTERVGEAAETFLAAKPAGTRGAEAG